MDEMELLVEETYKHFHLNYETTLNSQEIPADRLAYEDVKSLNESQEFYDIQTQNKEYETNSPAVIYRVDKSPSIFAVRTYVSKNLSKDWLDIKNFPENYPSLRLVGEENVENSLKYFIVNHLSEAQAIQDQVHNRRFPKFEEVVCNISDPGFSWWLTQKEKGFLVTFRMTVLTDSNTLKLGPIGKGEVAVEKFRMFENLLNQVHLNINIQNEINRVQFNGENDFLVDELKDLFEKGNFSGTLEDLFKFLEKKSESPESVRDILSYFKEISVIRKFWLKVEEEMHSTPENKYV